MALTVGTILRFGGLMDKVSATQLLDREYEAHTGDDHNSPYDTSTDCFQETDLRVI